MEPELGNSKDHEQELDAGDFLQGDVPKKHRELNVENVDTTAKEKDEESEEFEESDERLSQQHENP